MGAGLEEEAAAESPGPQAALGGRAGHDEKARSCFLQTSDSRRRRRGKRSCVLLLSGGLDSATCLALVSRWGWRVHALSFDYGQRHRVELRAARALARKYGVASHRVIAIPAFGALGGSALTDLRFASRSPRASRRPDPRHVRPRPQHAFPRLRARRRRVQRRDGDRHRRERPRLLRLPRLPPRSSSTPSSASRGSGRRPARRARALRSARRFSTCRRRTSSASRSPSGSTRASRRPATTPEREAGRAGPATPACSGQGDSRRPESSTRDPDELKRKIFLEIPGSSSSQNPLLCNKLR